MNMHATAADMFDAANPGGPLKGSISRFRNWRSTEVQGDMTLPDCWRLPASMNLAWRLRLLLRARVLVIIEDRDDMRSMFCFRSGECFLKASHAQVTGRTPAKESPASLHARVARHPTPSLATNRLEARDHK